VIEENEETEEIMRRAWKDQGDLWHPETFNNKFPTKRQKRMKTFDGRSIELPEGIRRNKIGWILRNSCTDINYRTTVPELTVQELEFCLEHEKRVTGKKQLRSELRRRKPKCP